MQTLSIRNDDARISLISASGKVFGGTNLRARIKAHPMGLSESEWSDFSTNMQITHEKGGLKLFGESNESTKAMKLKLTITWESDKGGNYIDEFVTITNESTQRVSIDDLDIGLSMNISSDANSLQKNWNLLAIPFRVQPDGKEYYFTIPELLTRKLANPTYHTDCKHWPDICDPDKLRSEAWYMGDEQDGLLVVKYNPKDIEYSMISIEKPPQADPHARSDTKSDTKSDAEMHFGGVGFSLYHEPSRVTHLNAGESFAFGLTRYIPIEQQKSSDTHTILLNAEQKAMRAYSDFLKSHNHTFPKDYNPPVHWNELYDIGWYHSFRKMLKRHYTKEALLREADKAVACHAEALYLDPGWEVCEGTTLFDEERLGTAEQLVADLQKKGLFLMFRTILRDYKGWVPKNWRVKHDRSDLKISKRNLKLHLPFKEPCLLNPEFYEEKRKRIAKIATAGVRFIMFDEMDWRGPCHNNEHIHTVPSTASQHANRVLDLCRDVRTEVKQKKGYDLLIEAHDPVWPWANRYCPSYYRQGFGYEPTIAYQENWGFEFMWNCITDLHTGKALTLYYYACSCSIPLYLHITMSHDNDRCLFLWWAASTVRHLGIGGKTCSMTLCPSKMKHPFDQEEQFQRYATAMEEYSQHKAWFVRGNFIGIDEDHHLHTLDNVPGGALVAFNLDLTEKSDIIRIHFDQINWKSPQNPPVTVMGALSHKVSIENAMITIEAKIPADSSIRVYMGDAAKK